MDVKKIVDKYRERKEDASVKKQLKILVEEIQIKDEIISTYELVKNTSINNITAKENKSIDEGTAISLLSDVHCAEKITRKSTNGYNIYTPEICKQRLNHYAINLCKLVESFRTDIKLDNLVLGLLGDFIHGFIHREYERTNYLTPAEETIFMMEVLGGVIEYIQNRLNLKRFVCICKIGNHSRTTEKPYSVEEGKLSFEWILYHSLKNKFPGIEWIIDESYRTDFKMYNRNTVWHHGHEIKYAGGIGGIFVPMTRYRLRSDKFKASELHFIGHFHQRSYSNGIMINGSVCGYNQYAIRKGFEPEAPQQQFLICDKKRGFTINAPIIL